MTRRTFDLPDHLDAFISRALAAGHYGSADEVVGSALTLLAQAEEERAVKAEALRAAVEVGLQDVRAGRVTDIPDGGVAEYMDGLLARARAGKYA